ncbi:MAG: zf-HC2 domain-containing protein [Deltaproteobacteria bacterium]|nr:zf-HC2 domain-containing protein [Deltaproteobacteria bacterium]
MKCASFEEMVQYLDGTSTPEQKAALAEHIAGCRDCAALRDRVSATAQAIAARPGEFCDPALASDVLELVRLGQAEPRPSLWQLWRERLRWSWVPLAAGAAAAALVLFVVDTDDGEFHTRGGAESGDAWVDLKVFRATATGYQPATQAIRADDALAFAYANQSRDRYRYLMVFARSEDGQLFWFYPAHVNVDSDPESIAICGDCATTPLPEEIEHPLPPGLLRVYALFSRQPLRVSAIEARAAREWQAAGAAELPRLSIEDTAQRQVLLQVRRAILDASRAE